MINIGKYLHLGWEKSASMMDCSDSHCSRMNYEALVDLLNSPTLCS